MILATLILATALFQSVTLAWDDASPEVTQWFNVYRATDSAGPFIQINAEPIPAPTTTYTDRGTLQPGRTYWYAVTAANMEAESEKSEMVSAAIPDTVAPSFGD